MIARYWTTYVVIVRRPAIQPGTAIHAKRRNVLNRKRKFMHERIAGTNKFSGALNARRRMSGFARYLENTSSNSSFYQPVIYRKASCACGGGCPSCQEKSDLKVSHPHDPAEIEADRIA